MALITGSRSTKIIDSLRETPDDIGELVTEMRRDPVVRLAERVIRSNAKAAAVSFNARNKTPQLMALAAVLEDRWHTHIASALECYAYGWQAFEVAPAITRGVQYPGELVPLPHAAVPPDLMEIAGGKVRSITLKGDGDDSKIELTRPYFWLATVDRTALRPLGSSQFKGAVESAWRDHKELRDRRKTFARKHVLGNAIVRAPKYEARQEDGREVIADVHSEITAAVKAADGGDLLILSCDRLMKADGSEGDYKMLVEREGGECKDASPLISLIDSVSDELLLANGIPPKTLVEGDGVGSFALVTQQMQILMNRVEEVFSAVFESYGEFVVEEYSLLNSGSRHSIEYTFTPIAERPDDLGREIVKAWMTSPQLSPLVLNGSVDIAAMLRAQGIPISGNFAAELAKLRVQPQQTAVGMSLPDSWRIW